MSIKGWDHKWMNEKMKFKLVTGTFLAYFAKHAKLINAISAEIFLWQI